MNTIKNHSKLLTGLMGFLLAVVVAGCGSDGGGSTQPGVLGVSITDAPACGFDAVNVTVSKVRVHQSDNASENAAGWTDITLNPPRKINLLDLNNGALASLGETPLEAGHYTQLRLVLDRNTGQSLANSVVLENTTAEIALDTPSAIQTGIKLIHQFTVNSGQRVDLLLDFDACKSIVTRSNGTYALKPVIKVIPFEQNGIVGFVDETLPNVVVSAQDNNGEIVRATVPNADGKFFLAHLTAGTDVTYNVVITADGHATAVISGVPVPTITSITAVSTSGAPIPVVTSPALEASATHSISGTVTLNPPTDEVAVFVAAKQTFGGGSPTVTVKFLAAAPLATPGDFSYSLTLLPTAAPSLGPYTALPIVFTQQPASVAGKYTVQASAAGYEPKSSLSLVDISGGDATSQDFTLTP
jgi:hypothetical protein